MQKEDTSQKKIQTENIQIHKKEIFTKLNPCFNKKFDNDFDIHFTENTNGIYTKVIGV